MECKWFVFCALVVCLPIISASEIISVLREVRPCFDGDVQPCLMDHAVRALLDVTNLANQINVTQEGRGFTSSVEEQLFDKLTDLIGNTQSVSDIIESGRQGPVRGLNKAMKYLVPFIIGIKLKLAAFVPLMLVVLTVIAKSALLSGNLALLFTGLNFFLKYWYPKWAQSQRTPFEHNPPMDFGHQEDYSQHYGVEPYSQPENPQENKYDRRIMFG